MRKFIAIALFGTMVLLNSCDQPDKEEPESIENKVKKDFGLDDPESSSEQTSDSAQ